MEVVIAAPEELVALAAGAIESLLAAKPAGVLGLATGSSPLGIYDDGTPAPTRPGRSVRIGLAEGKGDRSRLRWFVPGDEHVSGPRSTR